MAGKARANKWYKLFGNNQGDDRAKLTWRGRFADVVQKESMNTNTIPRLVLDAHLAQGIPAHNAAVGYCKPNNEMQEYNSIDLNLIGIQGLPRPNGWPERSIGFIITSNWGTRWLHSDIKDIAYYFTHKFFEKALEVGGLK